MHLLCERVQNYVYIWACAHRAKARASSSSLALAASFETWWIGEGFTVEVGTRSGNQHGL